jgi:hypothetical protein
MTGLAREGREMAAPLSFVKMLRGDRPLVDVVLMVFKGHWDYVRMD